MKVLVTQSCPTLCNPTDCSLSAFPVHGIFPGKNTGVGCHFLPQWIFPAQGLNLCLPYCRQSLPPESKFTINPLTKFPNIIIISYNILIRYIMSYFIYIYIFIYLYIYTHTPISPTYIGIPIYMVLW